MSVLRNIALVALGGGVGSVLRFALGMGAASMGLTPPWGTLCANGLGCLAGGVLLGSVASIHRTDDPWRLLLITGCLGGLTTFSALSMETVQMFRDGKTGLGIANMGGSVALGLCAVWAGSIIGRALASGAA